MSNAYYWHGRIKERKFFHLIRCFAADKTAKETAEEIKLDRKSVNGIFMKIRRRILEDSYKKQSNISLRGFKTSLPYFVAGSERDCEKYSRNYKSKILIILFKGRSFETHLVYAEADKIFDEILENIKPLHGKEIKHRGFYNLDNKQKLVNFGFESQSFKAADDYLNDSGVLKEHSGWLLSYFFHRTKKFKGINSNNFILHLKETEWRANKIPLVKELREKTEKFRVISNNLYDELIENLTENRL